MNKISDRRKLHVQNKNQEQQFTLLRMATNASVVNNAPPSTEQLRKIIRQLQSSLKAERQKSNNLQQSLKLYQERTMAKQKEFYKILKQKNKQVYKYSKPSQKQDTITDIQQTYEHILHNFQQSNHKMSEIIENKYIENLNAMERRIANIISVMNEEIINSRKMSNENVNAIKRQIQQAFHIVKTIQQENAKLKIAINHQKHKNKLIQEQRKLLLEQIVNKKFLLVRLLEQNKKYKAKMSKIQKQMERYEDYKSIKIDEFQEVQIANSARKLKTISSTLNHLDSKSIQNSKIKNQNKQDSPNTNKHSINNLRNTFHEQRQRPSSYSQSQYRKNSSLKQTRNLINPNTSASGYSGIGQKINYKNLQKKYGRKQQKNKSAILYKTNESQCLFSLTKNRMDSRECSIDHDFQGNEKTIQHLKACLERQRRKVSQLGKIISRMQLRNNQINEQILEILNEARFKQCSTGQSMETVIRYEGLLKLIADLKGRLAVCQNPTLQCGWGQVEISKLLQQLGENVDKVDSIIK